VRVGGGDEVLAVQPLLGLDLGPVDGQPTAGLLAKPPAESGVIAQRAFGLGVRGLRLVLGVRAGLLRAVAFPRGLDPGELGFQPGDGVLAGGAVATGLLGDCGR
jgi:hypothetical protein